MTNFLWQIGQSGPLSTLRPSIEQAANTGVSNALSSYAAPSAVPMVGTIPYESDGPNSDPIGTQFSDMTPGQLGAEFNNLGYASDAMSMNPQSKEGWGTKAAVSFAGGLMGGLPGVFDAMAYGVNTLGRQNALNAFSQLSVQDKMAAMTAMNPMGLTALSDYFGEYGSPNELGRGADVASFNHAYGTNGSMSPSDYGGVSANEDNGFGSAGGAAGAAAGFGGDPSTY